ncbi:hypothetical protein [Bdellovibrio sp. KM01]|uniref:hypothetical protein n=1 Tax=Bdellovibrio sp. KM01 TaxID=2748865 RepID=UPI0015E9994C|nr:hypothetical protein [Bdellovibrio sp. KM01]QLY24804.1 hypothetical protein HW988_15400 [Bdellovibrio sp. KM01]
MNKVKKIPLSIKVPVFSAIFLSLVLLFVTLFENLPKSAGVPLQCQVKYSGPIKVGDQKMGLLTHLYINPDGQYMIAGLTENKDGWLIGKMGFAEDAQPYWDLNARHASSLKNSGAGEFQLAGTNKDWAFIRSNLGQIVAVNLNKSKALEKSNLGLCTGNWSEDVRIQRVNRDNVVFANAKGQIGFYDLRRLSDYVPKGVGRSPDTLMVVDPDSSLSVGQCNQLAENRHARLRVDDGLMGFSSGISGTLSLYSVAVDKFKLDPLPLSPLKDGLADFVVSKENVFGVKVSGWLDRTEQWKLYKLSDLANNRADAPFIMTAEPLAFRGDYSLEESKKVNGYWVAERYKSYYFFDKFLLTHVTAEGTKQSYEIDDPFLRNSLAHQQMWVVLPGQRHLLAANTKDGAGYSVIECK